MSDGTRVATLATYAITAALVVGDSAFREHAQAATPDEVGAQLIGSWSLESRITTTLDGRLLTDPGLSGTPHGLLVYDRAGHVAAQLSRPGRTVQMLADECRDAQQVRGTPDTAQTILGYDAYFGTYSLDVKAGIVTHHLESALFPGDIGKSIIRHFAVTGDTLTIKFNTTQRDGTAVTRTLTWKRLK
jgi:hypothetical protein